MEKQKLTDRQRQIAFATILTDGWLEIQKGGKNARLGLQQAEQNKELFDWWRNEFKDLISEPVRDKWQKSPSYADRKYLQYSIRTKVHPEFTELYNLFHPNKVQKLVPKVSVLCEYLSYEVLAIMLMQDGSVKSKDSKGMELHIMNFSYESVARMCLALREKLDILCKPTREFRKGKVTWTLYISGASHDLLVQEVKQYILPSFLYKIPIARVNRVSPLLSEREEDNTSFVWYEANKNAGFREDISKELLIV